MCEYPYRPAVLQIIAKYSHEPETLEIHTKTAKTNDSDKYGKRSQPDNKALSQ